MVWSWTPSPDGLPGSFIPRPTLPSPDLKPPTAGTSLIWPSATSPLEITKSTTGAITGWDFPSTITSWPSLLISSAPVVLRPLSPAGTPWTPRIRKSGATWDSEPSCWEPSVCPTPPSRPMPVRKWSRIFSSCKSGTGPWIWNRTGCIWVRQRMATRSTAISWITRKWFWVETALSAPPMAWTIRCSPWKTTPLGIFFRKRCGTSRAATGKRNCRIWMKALRSRTPFPPTRRSRTIPTLLWRVRSTTGKTASWFSRI